MGGCSSKPKTAEFEGAMEIQEEKAQDGLLSQSIEVERIGMDAGLKDIIKQQETSECDIQNAVAKEGHDFDMLADAETRIFVSFDAEGESKVERKDNHMNVKQVADREINGDLFSDRETAGKEEVDKGSKILAPASLDPHEDPIFIEVDDSDLKKTPVVFDGKAGTVNSGEEPLTSSKNSVEMQVQPVMSGYETSAAQEHISHDKRPSHLQHDDSKTSGTDACIEAEKAMVLQESLTPEDIDLELQKYPFEEARKRVVTLESQEAGDGNEGRTLDHSPRQKKQVGTVEIKPQDKSETAGNGVMQLESQTAVHETGGERLVNNPKQNNNLEECKGFDITANGACMLCSHSEQRGEEVLRDKSLLLGKDLSAKGEAIDIPNSDACTNTYQSSGVEHNCSLDGGVHQGQMQAKGVNEAANEFAYSESFVKSHAEPVLKDLWPVNNGLQKDSSGEMVSDDGWYILEKVEVQNNGSLTLISEEKDHKGLPENGDDLPADPSRNDVICDDKVLSSLKVIVVSKEKPVAQPVHALDPVRLAFQKMVAQDRSSPDIDDVLEKLASEFERQESLARSNS